MKLYFRMDRGETFVALGSMCLKLELDRIEKEKKKKELMKIVR